MVLYFWWVWCAEGLVHVHLFINFYLFISLWMGTRSVLPGLSSVHPLTGQPSSVPPSAGSGLGSIHHRTGTHTQRKDAAGKLNRRQTRKEEKNIYISQAAVPRCEGGPCYTKPATTGCPLLFKPDNTAVILQRSLQAVEVMHPAGLRAVWKWFDLRCGVIRSVPSTIRGSMKFAVAVLWFLLAVGRATMQGKARETGSSLNCWSCATDR